MTPAPPPSRTGLLTPAPRAVSLYILLNLLLLGLTFAIAAPAMPAVGLAGGGSTAEYPTHTLYVGALLLGWAWLGFIVHGALRVELAAGLVYVERQHDAVFRAD